MASEWFPNYTDSEQKKLAVVPFCLLCFAVFGLPNLRI